MDLDSETRLPECIEGSEAFKRFDAAMKSLLAVPHSTLARRERAYKKRSAKNPNRPLFVDVAEQVKRFHADVGPKECNHFG